MHCKDCNISTHKWHAITSLSAASKQPYRPATQACRVAGSTAAARARTSDSQHGGGVLAKVLFKHGRHASAAPACAAHVRAAPRLCDRVAIEDDVDALRANA